ncbi:MAG: TetR/AcrR family transcriptional regulator; helix-turn-helix transcriptional regulator [Clostridiales Family XIII bacterium]|nr:TetR/AcrR family transcriptional regulator; helix-turn-helix transcriptional regulator [Clostridiales Family XIII bacterium]
MKRKSNVMREKIVSSARKMISENGLQKAGIAEIAKLAGISPTTIYSYFSSKQALFDELGLDESLIDYQPSKDIKKREIIEVALLYFGQKGYAGTTIESIMRKTGLGKTAFYQYFDSKESLFATVLHESIVNLKSRNLQINPASEGWMEMLKDLGEIQLEMGNDPKRKAIFLTVARQSAIHPDFGRIFCEDGMVATSHALAERLKPFQGRGLIRKDVDIELVALLFLMSLWAQNVMFKYIHNGARDFSDDETLDAAIKIFTHGLSPH